MIKTVLLLLYIYRGVPVLEQIPHKNQAECEVAAISRAKELDKDPYFDYGIAAYCIDLKVQLAMPEDRHR